jgi:hypothetical protein
MIFSRKLIETSRTANQTLAQTGVKLLRVNKLVTHTWNVHNDGVRIKTDPSKRSSLSGTKCVSRNSQRCTSE